MLSKRDLERTIEELEQCPISYQSCEKLATFYTIYDHLYGEVPQVKIPQTEEKIGEHGGTDFLKAVSGMSAERAWALVNELVDAIQVTNPRLYDSFMRKVAE